MTELSYYMLPPEQHKERRNQHFEYGKLLKESIPDFSLEHLTGVNLYVDCSKNNISLDSLVNIDTCANFPVKKIPMANDYDARNFPFGPVNTLQKAGCVSYITNYILRHYGKNIDIFEWTLEIVKKGYRIWRFENYPIQNFCTPKINIDEVKKTFIDIVPNIKECTTIGGLQRHLGKLEGVGGSMYLIDNVISMLSSPKLVPVLDTRIYHQEKILLNLEDGIMVPIRVNNRVYTGDGFRTGGHYVIIIAIKNGMAYVLDSSIGIKSLPFEQLMKAATEDSGLIACWDLSHI